MAEVSLTKIKSRKKKVKAKITKGKIYINSTYNNTIVCLTDMAGNVLVWSSAGKIGFKGSKKSTPYAGQRTMEDVLAKVKERKEEITKLFELCWMKVAQILSDLIPESEMMLLKEDILRHWQGLDVSKGDIN